MNKPILFNTEMVQAILEGQKTVTRRIINKDISNGFDVCKIEGAIAYIDQETGDSYPPTAPCRYQTGDVMWVRETWKILDVMESASMRFEYLAGGKISDAISISANRLEKILKFFNKKGWIPCLFMPREAARIFLKVKSVRAERLNEITVEDALSEGVALHGLYNEQCYAGGCYNGDFETSCKVCKVPINGFESLWNSTIKPDDLVYYGWDANPWVWVISFERTEKPEDFA